MTLKEKMTKFLHVLILDTRDNRIRWQRHKGGCMRTVSPIPSKLHPMDRRYVFMFQGLDGSIAFSLSGTGVASIYRDTLHIPLEAVVQELALDLYSEALKHEEQVSEVLEDLIRECEGCEKDCQNESPHWMFNGIRDIVRSSKKFVNDLFRKG